MTAVHSNLWFGHKQRRSLLSACDQKIYDALFNGLKDCQKCIVLPKNASEYYSRLLTAVVNDNPLIFNVEKFSIATSFSKTILQPRYRLYPDRYRMAVQEVEKDVSSVTKIFDRSGTWSTVEAIHSFILDNIRYSDYGVDAHSVIGLVAKRMGVCEGIAKYVKLLCDAMCIKCVVVSGRAITPENDSKIQGQNNHAWNAIQISGKWYYFDFTFDLSLSASSSCENFKRYDYYAVDANSIAADHYDSDIEVVPVGTNQDYYTQKRLLARNQLELNNIILRSITGNNRSLAFKVSDQWRDFDLNESLNTILKLPQINFLATGEGITYSYNSPQRICFLMVNQRR